MVEANAFPIFKPNQVLTDEHLSSLQEYLDEQDRYTRCKLIGIGIVCGFNISFNNVKDALILTKGCGVTSQGYLACIESDTTFTHFTTFVGKSTYDPFKNLGVDILELHTNEAGDSTPVQGNETILSEYIPLVFVDYEDETVEACIVDNCDEHGQWRVFQLRVLLVDKNDAKKLIDCNVDGIPENLNKKFELETLAIERICCTATGAGEKDKDALAEFKTYYELANCYVVAIDNALDNVLGKIELAFDCYSPVLTGKIDEESYKYALEKIKKLKDYIGTILGGSETIPLAIQYYYDFIEDIISAYNEFIDEALDLMSECCPDTTIFPRHLLLGELKEPVDSIPTVYRHYFKQPPIYNGNADRLKKVVRMFSRIILIIKDFKFFDDLDEDEIIQNFALQITPSKDQSQILGDRSIPYYYHIDGNMDSLYNYWDFDKFRKYKADLNLSYHSKEYSEWSYITNPLCYSLDKYPFFRIEGLLGKDIKEAYETIETLRRNRNLPFEILNLYIGDKSLLSSNESYGYEDLQVTYSIWRNKVLLYLNNLVWLTHTIEKNWLKTKQRSKGLAKANNELMTTTGAKILDAGIAKKSYTKTPTMMNTGSTNIESLHTSEELKKINEIKSTASEFGVKEELSYVETIRLYNKFLEGGSTLDEVSKIKVNTGTGPTAAEEHVDAREYEPPKEEARYLSPEEKFVRDTIGELGDYIRELIRNLQLDLKDFKLNEFLGTYQKCIMINIDIIKYLVSKITKDDYDDNTYLIMQILSWVHRFLSALAIHPYVNIRLLSDNFSQRETGSAESLGLFDFLKENRGIEHNAGVTRGGTFIVVYQSESEKDITDDREKKFVEKYTGKVIADFYLPYLYKSKDIKRPVVAEPLTPLVLPKCMVIRPFDDKETELLNFPENEMPLLNNLYDPEVFIPEVPKDTLYGNATIEKRVYEPDVSKKKSVLLYTVDNKKIDKALKEDPGKVILIDEFEYGITNISEKKSVGKSTMTIFICTEPESQSGPGIVTGTVLSVDTNGNMRPLAGAEILDANQKKLATTDGKGNYGFDIAPGMFTFTATAARHGSVEKSIKVVSGGNTLDFELTYQTGEASLSGVVYSITPYGKKQVLNGAQVTDSEEKYYTKTDSQGHYLMAVEPGKYSFIAKMGQHDTEVISLEVIDGGNTLDFELKQISDDRFNEKYGELFDVMKVEITSQRAKDIAKAHDARMEALLDEIEAMKRDPDLDPGTPVYSVADTIAYFVNEPKINIITMNNEYIEKRDELFDSIGKSKDRARAFQVKAYKMLTMSYIDRLALEQPKEFSSTTVKALQQTKAQMAQMPELSMGGEIDTWSDSTNGLLPDNFIGNIRKGISRS